MMALNKQQYMAVYNNAYVCNSRISKNLNVSSHHRNFVATLKVINFIWQSANTYCVLYFHKRLLPKYNKHIHSFSSRACLPS